MATDSTTTTNGKPNKPEKPYPEFPLFPHATRRWAKKIKGTLHYFGSWADGWEAALNTYQEQRDDLFAGRRPRKSGDGLTVAEACNHFLAAKERKTSAGEMQRRTWLEYKVLCETITAQFGRNRLVSDLASDDFGELRATLAKGKKSGRGVESLGRLVQHTRCVFKHAYDAGLIAAPVRFGPEFVRPGKAARRRNKQARPVKLFSAAEIRKLLDKASIPMRAMIYLGINAGLGNNDCSELRLRHLDLDKGILDYPRPKTAIDRRATLWPETVAAIRAAIEARPDPKDAGDADRVFVTRYGQPWVKFLDKGNVNSVTLEFGKLLDKLKIKREGVSFYALRHTFETVAGETGQQAVVNRVMGHEDADMASLYREWVRDRSELARLKQVTEHVRKWLNKGAKRPKK